MPFYEDYVNAASQHRMTSSYVEHHGMMTEPPPALFTYHNVQKKSCLVEECEEEEREEESEFFESEEDFVESCLVEEEEEEIGEEAGLGDDCGRGREMSPSSSVKSLQAEARRRFSGGLPAFSQETFFTLFFLLSGRSLLPVPLPALRGLSRQPLYSAGRPTQLHSGGGGGGGGW